MKKINVGIIDDDKGKVASVRTKLKLHKFKSDSRNEKYSEYKINPIQIEIEQELDDMVNALLNENFYDVLLVDYKLSSQSTARYNGVELADEILSYNPHHPLFILTSYEDDLYSKEFFSAYKVFDIARFLRDEVEREEIYVKIIKQYEYTIEQKKKWKEELLKLTKLENKTDEQLSREIELDNLLEETILVKNKTSIIDKVESKTNKFDELINKLDKLIED